MSISVVFVVKNAIKQGYCFYESLLSSLPFASEYIISEGHSEDDTMRYIKSFYNAYNFKVPMTIFQDRWEDKSYHGEVISKVSQRAINRASCDWIYYLQADEIIHEDTAQYIKNIPSLYNDTNINGVYFPFYHFIRSWEPAKKAAYHNAIRMIRKETGKLSGDGWTFKIDGGDIVDASLCPKPIYHFAYVFPKQNDIKDIEHAKIYQNFPEYQEKMRLACQHIHDQKKPYPRTDFDDFPELAKKFVGLLEYPLS